MDDDRRTFSRAEVDLAKGRVAAVAGHWAFWRPDQHGVGVRVADGRAVHPVGGVQFGQSVQNGRTERDQRGLLVGVAVVQNSIDGKWLLRRDDDEYGAKWFVGETAAGRPVRKYHGWYTSLVVAIRNGI